MAFKDYSTTPASNVSIGGINIDEGCPAGNVNNAVRVLMADAKSFQLTAPDASTLMPKSGGTFTGNITRSSRGGYLHFKSGTLTDGQVIAQPLATALPAPAEGMIVLQY